MLYGRFIQSKQVDKVAPFHDPLKTLKLKTLASDCAEFSLTPNLDDFTPTFYSDSNFLKSDNRKDW